VTGRHQRRSAHPPPHPLVASDIWDAETRAQQHDRRSVSWSDRDAAAPPVRTESCG